MSYQNIAAGVIRLGLPYVPDDPTPGDGNCFFHAVMQQLQRESDCPFISHLDLRRKLVEFVANDEQIRENEGYRVSREQYIQNHMIDGESSDATWMRCLDQMSQDGVWAEDLFITSMAIFLKRRICLTSNNQSVRNPWIVFNGETGPVEMWKSPLTIGMVPNVEVLRTGS